MRIAALKLALVLAWLAGCGQSVVDESSSPAASARPVAETGEPSRDKLADRVTEKPAAAPSGTTSASSQPAAAAPQTRSSRTETPADASPARTAPASPQDPFSTAATAEEIAPRTETAQAALQSERRVETQAAADPARVSGEVAVVTLPDTDGPLAAPPEPSSLWMWLLAAGVTLTVASLGLLALQPSWKRSRWWRLLKAYLNDWSTGGYDRTPPSGVPSQAQQEEPGPGPLRVVPFADDDASDDTPTPVALKAANRPSRRSSTHVTLPLIKIFKDRKKG